MSQPAALTFQVLSLKNLQHALPLSHVAAEFDDHSIRRIEFCAFVLLLGGSILYSIPKLAKDRLVLFELLLGLFFSVLLATLTG